TDSATSCSTESARRRGQLGHQRLHPLLDLVADAPHGVDVLASEILERPVLIALARVDRARVTAAHGDDDVGRLHHLVGHRLRELPRNVEPDLGQRRDDRGIELVSRIAPRRADVHLALGVPIQQRGRHLTAAGIVHAHEQDLGHLVAHVTTSSSTTCGTTTWRAESRTRGYSTAIAPTASAAPTTWAMTNAGTDGGA